MGLAQVPDGLAAALEDAVPDVGAPHLVEPAGLLVDHDVVAVAVAFAGIPGLALDGAAVGHGHGRGVAVRRVEVLGGREGLPVGLVPPQHHQPVGVAGLVGGAVEPEGAEVVAALLQERDDGGGLAVEWGVAHRLVPGVVRSEELALRGAADAAEVGVCVTPVRVRPVGVPAVRPVGVGGCVVLRRLPGGPPARPGPSRGARRRRCGAGGRGRGRPPAGPRGRAPSGRPRRGDGSRSRRSGRRSPRGRCRAGRGYSAASATPSASTRSTPSTSARSRTSTSTPASSLRVTW